MPKPAKLQSARVGGSPRRTEEGAAKCAFEANQQTMANQAGAIFPVAAAFAVFVLVLAVPPVSAAVPLDTQVSVS